MCGDDERAGLVAHLAEGHALDGAWQERHAVEAARRDGAVEHAVLLVAREDQAAAGERVVGEVLARAQQEARAGGMELPAQAPEQVGALLVVGEEDVAAGAGALVAHDDGLVAGGEVALDVLPERAAQAREQGVEQLGLCHLVAALEGGIDLFLLALLPHLLVVGIEVGELDGERLGALDLDGGGGVGEHGALAGGEGLERGLHLGTGPGEADDHDHLALGALAREQFLLGEEGGREVGEHARLVGRHEGPGVGCGLRVLDGVLADAGHVLGGGVEDGHFLPGLVEGEQEVAVALEEHADAAGAFEELEGELPRAGPVEMVVEAWRVDDAVDLACERQGEAGAGLVEVGVVGQLGHEPHGLAPVARALEVGRDRRHHHARRRVEVGLGADDGQALGLEGRVGAFAEAGRRVELRGGHVAGLDGAHGPGPGAQALAQDAGAVPHELLPHVPLLGPVAPGHGLEAGALLEGLELRGHAERPLVGGRAGPRQRGLVGEVDADAVGERPLGEHAVLDALLAAAHDQRVGEAAVGPQVGLAAAAHRTGVDPLEAGPREQVGHADKRGHGRVELERLGHLRCPHLGAGGGVLRVERVLLAAPGRAVLHQEGVEPECAAPAERVARIARRLLHPAGDAEVGARHVGDERQLAAAGTLAVDLGRERVGAGRQLADGDPVGQRVAAGGQGADGIGRGPLRALGVLQRQRHVGGWQVGAGADHDGELGGLASDEARAPLRREQEHGGGGHGDRWRGCLARPRGRGRCLGLGRGPLPLLTWRSRGGRGTRGGTQDNDDRPHRGAEGSVHYRLLPRRR